MCINSSYWGTFLQGISLFTVIFRGGGGCNNLFDIIISNFVEKKRQCTFKHNVNKINETENSCNYTILKFWIAALNVRRIAAAVIVQVIAAAMNFQGIAAQMKNRTIAASMNVQ